MRAPSAELLRALRTAMETSTIASRSRRCQISRCSRRTCLPLPTTQMFTRSLSTSSPAQAPPAPPRNPYAPRHTDRGPASKEDTQTDFGKMDVLGHIPAPATSIDACTTDGFHLDNGIKTTGGVGIIVVGGEAFTWSPWLALPRAENAANEPPRIGLMLDARRGILHIPPTSLGILALLYPKPDLLMIGTGARLWMLSPETKKYINEELGCRVDVMDTGNAASAYNLLAKERGVEGGAGVGGAFLPVGWRGPEGTGKR